LHLHISSGRPITAEGLIPFEKRPMEVRKNMATQNRNIERTTVVGVFHNAEEARRAVDDLHRAGFTDKQIGVVA
jgi:hypothetical protein